jgi:hypothetical protein
LEKIYERSERSAIVKTVGGRLQNAVILQLFTQQQRSVRRISKGSGRFFGEEARRLPSFFLFGK